MKKTDIEWTDYTWNPITGCKKGCSYCYARKMAENPFYAKAFPYKFEPHFYPERLKELYSIPDDSKVFVCSMAELFAEGYEGWTQDVLTAIGMHKGITFQLLTKQPQNLIKYSLYPRNVWVGASVTNAEQLSSAYLGLKRIKSNVKFLSYEPLLDNIYMPEQYLKDAGINWVIIGQETPVRKSTMPKVGWIEEIVNAADKANIPVFLKNNLISCVDQYPFAFTGKFPDIKLRQEFPKLEK